MSPSRVRLPVAFLIPLAALILSAGYWSSQFQAHQTLRDAVRQGAEHRVDQLATAVAQQTDTLLQLADVTLQVLANEYVDEDLSGFLRSVTYAQAGFPAIAAMQVSVADAKGRLVYSTVKFNAPISVADREYFQVHRRAPTPGSMFVGSPLLARTTQTWSIPFSRPVFNKRGFAGVVTIGLSPAYLSQRWNELKLLPRDSVSIVRSDGSYLARATSEQQAMTAHTPADRPFLQDLNQSHGLMESGSTFDGVHRLRAWQRLGTGKMVAVVGLDLEAVMAPTESHIQQSVQRNIVANGLLFLVSLLMAWLVQRLQHNRAMLQAIYDVLPVGIVVTDPKGHIVDCNHMSEELLQLDRANQLTRHIGEPAWQGVYPDGTPMPPAALPSMRALHDGQAVHHEEVGCILPGQTDLRWFSVSAVPCGDAGYGVVIAFTDITKARCHREEIEHIACHDALTGLPNRRRLSDRIDQALRRSERQPGTLAVCFLDLDGFKPVNDRYGHEAGDRLLVEMAQRLQAVLRADDTVARLGGDEFVVVLNGLSGLAELDEILRRIAQAVATPIDLGAGQSACVTASIGVAVHPHDGADADALLRYADQAMYRAKQSGQHVCRMQCTPQAAPLSQA